MAGRGRAGHKKLESHAVGNSSGLEGFKKRVWEKHRITCKYSYTVDPKFM